MKAVMQVVDGGNWLWKPQRVARESVTATARNAEKKSRDMLPASKAKL